MRGDAQALRQLFKFAKPFGFRHRVSGDIAHCDIAALGDQLAREFAAHARAAPGDDSYFSGKFLHGSISFHRREARITEARAISTQLKMTYRARIRKTKTSLIIAIFS